MHRSGRACLVCVAATILVSAGMVRGPERQVVHLSDHASHAPVSREEHALRALLARYGTGDVDGAVAGLIANRPDWSRRVLDACTPRIDEHIKYHRRSENRLGAARDERLEQLLRADRQTTTRDELVRNRYPLWKVIGELVEKVPRARTPRPPRQATTSRSMPIAVDHHVEVGVGLAGGRHAPRAAEVAQCRFREFVQIPYHVLADLALVFTFPIDDEPARLV